MTNAGQKGFTKEEIALARKTTCKDLNDEQMELFCFKCLRYGTHILDGQLYPTVRTDRRTGKQTLAVIVGIDFMRMVAAKTGSHAGTSLPLFSGTKMKADWVVQMKVERWVQGAKAEFWAEVDWVEYYPGKNFMWDSKPKTMIAKVCESHALRRGFPMELAGLYTEEEMERAEEPEMDLGKAMTQDFPEHERLAGVLQAINPPNAETGEPAQAVILMPQVFDCPLPFHCFDPPQAWLDLVGHPITFRWQKQKKFKGTYKVVVEIQPRPSTSLEAQRTVAVKPEPQVEEDPAARPDPGMDHTAQDHFEPEMLCSGLVLKVATKKGESAKGPWEKTTLTIEPKQGAEITCSTFAKPEHFSLRSYQELYQKAVWFMCVQGKEYPKGSGKHPLELDDICLDPQWSSEESEQGESMRLMGGD